MDLMSVLVTFAGVGLLVAGAVVVAGAWAAVIAGLVLTILGVMVDWERLA